MKLMTHEERTQRIKELEAEIKMLKKENASTTIQHAVSNQDELSFIFPYFHEERGWERSTSETFLHLRGLTLAAVRQVTPDNELITQKAKELTKEDFNIVVACAEELVSVVAKYRKKYLMSVGREDVIEAFGLKND